MTYPTEPATIERLGLCCQNVVVVFVGFDAYLFCFLFFLTSLLVFLFVWLFPSHCFYILDLFILIKTSLDPIMLNAFVIFFSPLWLVMRIGVGSQVFKVPSSTLQRTQSKMQFIYLLFFIDHFVPSLSFNKLKLW